MIHMYNQRDIERSNEFFSKSSDLLPERSFKRYLSLRRSIRRLRTIRKIYGR